jgi:HEAT repeat protein
VTYELRSNTITFEAALRDLGSPRPAVRAQAAHALGDVTAPAERARAVTALIQALGDPRFEVRAEAALALGELGSEDAVPALVARFDDAAAAVRQAAIIALGRLGLASAFEPVARALAEGPPDVRFQAATSLAEIDAARAAGPLLTALEDSDGEVVGAVAVALGALGERRAIAPLAALLDSWSRPETRFDIAYALADLGDARAVDTLGGFADHKQLGWDAIEALEKLGTSLGAQPDADAAPGTETDPGTEPDIDIDVDAIRSAAADYLVPLLARRFLDPMRKLRAAGALLALDPDHPGVDSARTLILAGLGARKREQVGLAVELLGRVGGDWARAPLAQLRGRRAGKPFHEEIDEVLARLGTP